MANSPAQSGPRPRSRPAAHTRRVLHAGSPAQWYALAPPELAEPFPWKPGSALGRGSLTPSAPGWLAALPHRAPLKSGRCPTDRSPWCPRLLHVPSRPHTPSPLARITSRSSFNHLTTPTAPVGRPSHHSFLFSMSLKLEEKVGFSQHSLTVLILEISGCCPVCLPSTVLLFSYTHVSSFPFQLRAKTSHRFCPCPAVF